jgi:DNA invertase Pin-like site-specific DNA recombinase
MKYGYARVSTAEQSLNRQIDKLKSVGIDKIITDIASGGEHRPNLQKLLNDLNKGDILVVTKLFRLVRSIKNFQEIMEILLAKGVDLVCIDGGKVDTTTAQGKLFWNTIAVISEVERDLIRERTKEGVKAAQQRGKHIGRPKIPNQTKNKVISMVNSKMYSKAEVAKLCDISRASIYNILRES